MNITEQKQCCYDKLENTPQNNFAWSLREMIARKASLTIWGRGYLFQSNNEKMTKLFKKVEFLNQLGSTFGFVERQCSKYGRAIITINKTKSGDFMLNVADPYYFNGVGKVFVQPQLAVIWQRFVHDNRTFLVESRYDTQKVKTLIWHSPQGSDKIQVLGEDAEILKELQIEKEWVHNLGFVPVVELVNIDFYQTQFNNSAYSTLADWFPAYHYENIIYETIENLKKELRFCHSRVAIENASQHLIEKLERSTNSIDQDMIFNTETGSQVSYLPGNGDFVKYTQTVDSLLDMYCKFAGLSRFSEGGGAQKTVAETSSIRSAMIENTNQKINLRQNQVKDLLRKIFACYGVINNYWEFEPDEEFDFKINGNILKDETSWIDNQLKLIENGIRTPIDVIQDLDNIPKDQAERKFESNKDWLDENLISFGDNDFNGDENSNFNKNTGEHKDLAKQGKQ